MGLPGWCSLSPRVSPSRAPVLSCAHYFQAPKFPLKLNDMHRLQKVRTGIKFLTPTMPLDRFPITLTVLHSIHSYLKPELSYNLDHVMLWAAFAFAFFGFLRSSEFTCYGPFDPSVHLTSNDITLVPNSFSPSHMLVHINNPKLTPSERATQSPQQSPRYDYLLQAQPPSSHPLFAIVQPRQWLKWNNLTTELRTILQHCGLPTNNFYSQSFRIGTATTAAKAGLPPWLIKVLGRWSS